MTAPWVDESYPSKRGLSRSEAMHVLSHGPSPTWFEPAFVHGVLLPGVADQPYGYVHVHGSGEAFQCDVATWDTQDGLNWGLEHLYKLHSQCRECHGVLYFAPDAPLRLRMVLELDDDLDDEEAGE